MMSWAEFQNVLNTQANPGTLETFCATSDSLIAQAGGDTDSVPDGGDWGNLGIKPGLAAGTRIAVRSYCMLIEYTLPNGATGINVSAHAPNADRFL